MKTERIEIYDSTEFNTSTTEWIEVKAFVHSEHLRIVHTNHPGNKWRVYHWPTGRALSPAYRLKKSAVICCDRLIKSKLSLDCTCAMDFLVRNKKIMPIGKIRNLMNVEGAKKKRVT